MKPAWTVKQTADIAKKQSQGRETLTAIEDAGIAVLEISIQDIETKGNPREDFQDIEDLAKSIEEVGLLEPIVVRKRAKGFELIAGERRIRAFKKLKRKAIPAIVQDADFLGDDLTRATARIIENIQRDDLKPHELASAVEKLLRAGLSQRQIAKKLGRSETWVSLKRSHAELVKKDSRFAGMSSEAAVNLSKATNSKKEELLSGGNTSRANVRETAKASPKLSPAKVVKPSSKKAQLKTRIRNLEIEIKSRQKELSQLKKDLSRL